MTHDKFTEFMNKMYLDYRPKFYDAYGNAATEASRNKAKEAIKKHTGEYWESLRDIPSEWLERAYVEIIREVKIFPRPADFRRLTEQYRREAREARRYDNREFHMSMEERKRRSMQPMSAEGKKAYDEFMWKLNNVDKLIKKM